MEHNWSKCQSSNICRCVLDESGTDVVAKCCKEVMSRRKVAGAIMFLVNARDLQLE